MSSTTREPTSSATPKSAPFPSRNRLRALFRGGDNHGQDLRAIAIATSTLAIIAAAFAIQAARWLLIPIVTAFVISILLAPAVDALKKLRLGEGVRAAIVVLFSIITLATSIYSLARPAISFSTRLPEIVSDARDKLTGVEKAVTAVKEVTDEMDKITDLEPRADDTSEVVLAKPSVPEAIASSTRLIFVQSLFISVLVFFLLASRSDIKRKIMMAPNSFQGKLQAARTMRDIEAKVGDYMFTMLIINVGLGIATFAALWALGVPSPLLWGALAGLLNFIPYIGPIAITVLLGLTGIVNFDTPLGMAAPAMAYIALNFIESNFVTPTLVGVRLRLTPIAIILTVSFWTWIWGPIGAIISVPMLVVLKTICDRSAALAPLGVFIGELKPIDRRAVKGWRVQTYARA